MSVYAYPATRANSLPRHDLQNSTYFLSLTEWTQFAHGKKCAHVASRRALAVPSQQILKSNLEDSLNKDAHKRRLLLLFECGAVKVHKQSHEISFNQFCDRRPTPAAPNTRPKL